MVEAPPSSDTGAGAEALLGLAAGNNRPRLPSLTLADAERAGPEPPPLQLPTQQVSHAPSSLLPTAPSLSLPHAQPGLLRAPLPSALDLRPPAFPLLRRQDLPSLGEWAPQTSFRSMLPTFDPLQRLNPLQQPVLQTATPHVHSWDPGRPIPVTSAIPTVMAEYAMPGPTTHWPPPPHGIGYGYPQAGHLAANAYYYYHGVAQHEPPQPGLPSQHSQIIQAPSVVPISNYPFPSAVHQAGISPVPPRLELPLPVPRAGAPPLALGVKVPSVHDIPRLRETLPAIDTKFIIQKDTLLGKVKERGVLSDIVVPVVSGTTTKLTGGLVGPVHDAMSGVDATIARVILAPVALPKQEGLEEKQKNDAKEAKQKSPRAKRGRGIADLMNPTDTLPGQNDGPGHLEIDLKTTGQKDSCELQKASVAAESIKNGNPTDLANVKEGLRADKVEKTKSIVSPTPPVKEVVTKEVSPQPESVKPGEEAGKEPEKSDLTEDFEGMSDDDGDNEEDQDGESEETRCACGSSENSALMVACDDCNTWQHAKCMGYDAKVKVPDKYFCHICRPEGIMPGSVAYRKYKEKEKLQSKENDGSDSKLGPEIIFVTVKPMELRRHFAADMRQKKSGQKLSRSDLFQRYAALLRSQFGKHRHSVVEGLVLLLDMHRSEVVDKLDSALKRIPCNSAEKYKEDSSKRRSGSDASHDGAQGDITGVRSNGHGRINPQKRARSNSMSLEAAERATLHSEPNLSGDAFTDVEGNGADSGRGLSREDRKLQQAMKLFAQMEEREREKKKPRTGESGTSPRSGQTSRPKTPKQGPHVASPPPKLANAASHKDPGLPMKTVDLSETPALEREQDEKGPVLQRPHQKEQEPHSQSQQPTSHEQHQHKQGRKGQAGSASDSEVGRDTSKRDREHKPRDKTDRASVRRKDGSPMDASMNGGNGRQRSSLYKNRHQVSKRRRAGGVSKEIEKKSSTGKEISHRDPLLDFKMYVSGSVLGSRLIPKQRLSSLEQKIRETEELETVRFRDAYHPRFNRKELCKVRARQIARMNDWKKHPPAKKRFTTREVEDGNWEIDLTEKSKSAAKVTVPNRKKTSTVSVSMVVVSEKRNLPDKGQMLESSRLVLPSGKEEEDDSVFPSVPNSPSKSLCIKKRRRLRLCSGPVKNEAEKVATEKVNPTSVQGHRKSLSHSPPAFRSPSSPHISSPDRSRFSMLRSSPVRAPTGLRSMSPPAVARTNQNSSPISSPRSARPSPIRNSLNSSPRGGLRPDPNQSFYGKAAKFHSDSKPGVSMERRQKNVTISEKEIQSEPSCASGIVPPSILATSKNHALQGSSKPGQVTNGLGLRSIRSVQAPGISRTGMPANANRLQKGSAKGSPKAGTPQSSPRKNELSCGPAISDIFQQRLQGFLKPSSLSPGDQTSVGNGVKPVSYPRGQNGVTGVFSNGVGSGSGMSRSGNGFPPGALPSFRSKTMESGHHWRPGMPPKRQNVGFPSSKASAPNGPPVLNSSKSNHLSANDKTRYRGGRVEAPGRSDENVRNSSSGPYSNYPAKGNWAGGNGRGQKNETVPKTGRRERN